MNKHNHDHKLLNFIIKTTDDLVSLLILAAIIGIIFFIGFKVYELFTNLFSYAIEEVLHIVAVIIVLVKAYRLLYFYMKSHHVSIKYIVEISVIAPAVEIIFAPGNRELSVNILYEIFSLGNLIVYLFFYKKLHSIDNECAKEEASN